MLCTRVVCINTRLNLPLYLPLPLRNRKLGIQLSVIEPALLKYMYIHHGIYNHAIYNRVSPRHVRYCTLHGTINRHITREDKKKANMYQVIKLITITTHCPKSCPHGCYLHGGNYGNCGDDGGYGDYGGVCGDVHGHAHGVSSRAYHQ